MPVPTNLVGKRSRIKAVRKVSECIIVGRIITAENGGDMPAAPPTMT
jgi:hypothetical protein